MIQVVRTELSDTDYQLPHEPVSHSLKEAYNFFGKAQNKMIN